MGPYVVNVGSYKNGVGYGRWVHIDGWSEAVIGSIRPLEELGAEWSRSVGKNVFLSGLCSRTVRDPVPTHPDPGTRCERPLRLLTKSLPERNTG